MLLKENIKTYTLGTIVFILSLLLLSSTFITGGELENRIAKIFWFYSILPWVAIPCVLLALIRPFRFTLTDLLVFLYIAYSLLNLHYFGQGIHARAGILVLVGVTYFLFRILTSFSSGNFVNVALLAVGFIEAMWGVAQLYELTPSFHNQFDLTGSFFNPGPYSGFLVAIFPLALHYALTTHKWPHIISIGVVIALLLVLPATMSRSAWVAAIVGCAIVVGYHYHLRQQCIAFYRAHPVITPVATIVIFLVIGILMIGTYMMKKSSADGRLLIWKVSTTIIASHPVTGTGFGNFAGPYGKAQEAYFTRDNYTPQEELVADAPESAFNEFIQITVENGLIGLLLFLGIIASAIRNAYRAQIHKQAGHVGALIAFLIFSCFSYPFNVLPLAILFSLLTAQCTASSSAPSPRWIVGIFYLFLLVPVWYFTSGKTERVEAFKRWRSEQIYFNMQIFKRTVDNYRAIYPILKDHPAFLFEYGQCLSRTDNPDQSNRVLREAAVLSSDPMIYNIMGKNYQAMQQYDLAEATFLTASRMVPNRIYPLYLLAKMYAESGQIDKAIVTANLVINKKPKVFSSAVEEMQRDMRLLIRNY